MSPSVRPARQVPAALLLCFLAASVACHTGDAGGAETTRSPIHVPLWVDPASVRHSSRFRFSFDSPAALSALRSEERIDELVRGCRDDLEVFRRLTSWTRAQFEPGVPDPYPPIEARIILRDIRRGFTGGFCAQYNYVLVQALQSLGYPARYVTVVGHEVAEGWLRDARRWVCLDPLHSATYVDEKGRCLSVHELIVRGRRGRPITPGPGSLPGTADRVRDAFGRYQVWLRNDHVGRPLNFSDLARYKVEFVPEGDPAPAEGLWTSHETDLYFDPEAP